MTLQQRASDTFHFLFAPFVFTQFLKRCFIFLSIFASDSLNNALGAIRVLGLELIEEELKPHLHTVLINIKERSELLYLISQFIMFMLC